MADRMEPEWLSLDLALAVHDRQLAEHGGPSGVRDQGALDGALARPVNRWNCGEDDFCALAAALAAAYAFGIARNHPFTDGNKRTAWVFARLFLRVNGQILSFAARDAVEMVLSLAAGELSEDEVAAWFRDHLAPR